MLVTEMWAAGPWADSREDQPLTLWAKTKSEDSVATTTHVQGQRLLSSSCETTPWACPACLLLES